MRLDFLRADRTGRASPPGRGACLLAGLLWLAFAQAQQMQVIELRFRLAADVIPVVQPLLEPGGVITGMDGTLFVRTSPVNLEQIRQAIDVLDRQPRELLVSVGQGTVTAVDASSMRGSATIGSGDAQVGINAPPGADPGASVRVASRTQRANLDNVSTVRALEGTETFIAAGRSVPVTTTQVTQGWGGTVTQRTTQFRDASTGFYATIRLSGDRVTIEVAPRQQRIQGSQRGGPVVDTASLVTTVTGLLGEWIALGGVQQSGSATTGGLLVRGQQASASQYSTWVKVDEVP